MPENQIGLSTNRIEAFSDGVFAVAITLLILEVKVPEIEPGSTLFHALWPLWPKLLAYAVSFGVIGVFWIGHHIMFHYIKRSDRILLWLNTVLLMCISAIPFFAALLGEYQEDTTAVVLYGAFLCLTGLVFYFIWAHAARGHRLIRSSMPDDLISLGYRAVLIAPIVYAAAALIGFISPLASKTIYLLVPIAYPIPSRIDRLVDFKDSE
jgi:uncharacterized membrane protein